MVAQSIDYLRRHELMSTSVVSACFTSHLATVWLNYVAAFMEIYVADWLQEKWNFGMIIANG